MKALKNENLLVKIENSGSLALKPRGGPIPIHFFNDKNDETGVISSKLLRFNYNLDLLRDSIDTNITELADELEVIPPDVVPRELYNDVLDQLNEVNKEILIVNANNSSLQTELAVARAEIINLQNLNDNLELLKLVADNQLEVIGDRLSKTIEDLQTTIQKSISEAIQRTSLQARNEVLISENNSLKEQLFGRQSRIEAGAISSGTLFTVRPLDITVPSKSPIYAEQKYSGGLLGTRTNNQAIIIKNGKTIELFNASTEQLRISVDLNREKDGDQWINNINPITIEPQTARIIRLTTDINWKRNRKNRTYNGSILFTASQNNISEQITIATEIKRYR